MVQVRLMVKIRITTVVRVKVCQSSENRQDLGLSERFNLGHFPEHGNLPISPIYKNNSSESIKVK